MDAPAADAVAIHGRRAHMAGAVLVLAALCAGVAIYPLLARGRPFWLWLALVPLAVAVVRIARRMRSDTARFWIDETGLSFPGGFSFAWREAAELFVFRYRVHGETTHLLMLRASAPAVIAARRRPARWQRRPDDGSLAVGLDHASLPWEEIVEIVRARSGRDVPIQDGAVRDLADAHQPAAAGA